jgi:hypothetical protein
MGKWVKQAGIPVQVPAKRTVYVCEWGEEHQGDTCRCADAEPDVPENAKPGGFVTIRHSRKKAPRTADHKQHWAYGMTRAEARKMGLNPPTKSRRKPPAPNAPMWKMDNEQRRRAASRARSL